MTNYNLTNILNQETNNIVYNGTGTISMPEGPATEVPISIQVLNNSLGVILIDPKKIDNHFGTEPLYGIPLEERSG